jgi:hypothetical protein
MPKPQGWGENDQPVASSGGYGANDVPVGGPSLPPNPSDKIPAAKPPTPAGLRQSDPLPSVPTMGGEAARNLPRSFANYSTSGFGMGDSNQMHPDIQDTPGASIGNFGRNLLKSVTDTASDIGHTFRHPAESFAQEPIGTANTLGAPAQLLKPGMAGARALTKVNPERGMNRVFRPTPADAEFPDVSPEAVSDVKRFGGQTPQTILGNPKVGVNEFRRGGETPSPADITVQTLQQQGLEPWLDRARKMGVQIPGDEIVAATKKAIPDLMRVRDPQGAARLEQQAQQAFGGKAFSPDQFRDWLRTENGTLQSFYNKSAGAQGATEMAGTPTAIEKAQSDAVRDTLYRHLDPENAGAGPRSIQQRTGRVLDLRNAAERRSNAILGEKPITPMGALAQPLNAAVKLFRGDPMGAVGTLEHPFRGPSDALITKMFRQFPEGGDLPQPPPFQPRALLERGPIRMGTPDTSGPTGQVPTVNRGMGLASGNRLLGGATPLQKEPLVTPAPADTSGPTGTQPTVNRGIGLAAGNRTLGAPTQVPQGGFAVPQTETSGGRAGLTTDMVPVKHPVTGKIEYVPKWMIQGGK